MDGEESKVFLVFFERSLCFFFLKKRAIAASLLLVHLCDDGQKI